MMGTSTGEMGGVRLGAGTCGWMGLGEDRKGTALRTSYQSRFPRIFLTFLNGEVGGRGVTVGGLSWVLSSAKASLLWPGSPLAMHMPQNVGPDVGPWPRHSLW